MSRNREKICCWCVWGGDEYSLVTDHWEREDAEQLMQRVLTHNGETVLVRQGLSLPPEPAGRPYPI